MHRLTVACSQGRLFEMRREIIFLGDFVICLKLRHLEMKFIINALSVSQCHDFIKFLSLPTAEINDSVQFFSSTFCLPAK